MAMTRVGQNTKMVITGDLKQKDKQFIDDNGLTDFLMRMMESDTDLIKSIQFDRSNVERSEVVSEVLRLYGEE
jgi:hypothetical protein